MDSILLLLTYLFAAVIICLALYFLYCWNKDQQLQDENEEDGKIGFDIDLIKKPNDQDSTFS
jgi:hypothetical protein